MADVALVVTGKTLAHCHSGVRRFMEHPGGALDRSRDHNSFFSLDKFGLLNCKARVAALGPALQLVNGKKIAPADPHVSSESSWTTDYASLRTSTMRSRSARAEFRSLRPWRQKSTGSPYWW